MEYFRFQAETALLVMSYAYHLAKLIILSDGLGHLKIFNCDLNSYSVETPHCNSKRIARS